TQPVVKIKIIEPIPAPVPPNPATEPTALAGKKSLGNVCTLFIQAWKPNSTTPIRARATIEFVVNAANIPAGIRHAEKTITALRTLITDQPRDIIKPDIYPPTRLPASAATNGTQANRPI